MFLLGGERGGIFYHRGGGTEECVPFFVLDLGQESARISFQPPPPSLLAAVEAPALLGLPGGDVIVFLGEEGGKKWFLDVVGGEERSLGVGKKREELLFLAGECAGLLFFREFAREAE